VALDEANLGNNAVNLHHDTEHHFLPSPPQTKLLQSDHRFQPSTLSCRSNRKKIYFNELMAGCEGGVWWCSDVDGSTWKLLQIGLGGNYHFLTHSIKNG